MKNNWKKTMLGNVSRMEYGYTASADFKINGPKFLRITDIVSDQINWDEVPSCKISDKAYQKYKLKMGDIVVARTGATAGYAKLIRQDIDAVFASYLIRIIPSTEEIDSGFLGIVIESEIFKKFVELSKSGAAQPQANAPVLKNFEFSYPNISSQKKIFEVVDIYNKLIQNNTRRIQILEEIAQRLYEEWFVHFRFPGFEKVKMVDSELGKIPEGWSIKQLEDVLILKRGKNITKTKAVPGNIPVVGGGLEPSYFHNKSNVEGPVLTISASGANAGYVKLYYQNIWASDCSYVSEYDTTLLYFFFSHLKYRQKEIYSKQVGAAQPHIYPKDIYRLEIILAQSDCLEKYNNFAKKIFALIGILTTKNIILKETRDLLLPRLISGEIEV